MKGGSFQKRKIKEAPGWTNQLFQKDDQPKDTALLAGFMPQTFPRPNDMGIPRVVFDKKSTDKEDCILIAPLMRSN